MAILTADDLKDWLPQAAGNEDKLSAAIAYAEGAAAAYCFRDAWASASYDEYHDAVAGQRIIQVRNTPITAISSVTEQSQETTPTTLTAASGYDYNATTGRVYRRGASWSAGFQQVRVQYTGGYSTSTLPDALKGALLELCGWWLDRRGGRGNTSESIDGASETHESLVRGIPMSIASQLDQFVPMVTTL